MKEEIVFNTKLGKVLFSDVLPADPSFKQLKAIVENLEKQQQIFKLRINALENKK